MKYVSAEKYAKMQCTVCTVQIVQKLSWTPYSLSKNHLGDAAEVV